jgi:outer membrane protein
MKRIIFLFCLIALSATAGISQKYGHLNFGNLITLLPETEAADKELEEYQKQLVAKGEEMAKSFQEKYIEFVKEVQGGNLPPVKQQEQQTALQQQQQEILDYEQEIVDLVQKKREELLKPIIDKADSAVQEVAKENGYTFIFDTSIFNAVLFASEADDVLPLVKAKLGIKEEE